jgi:hypothetical protein
MSLAIRGTELPTFTTKFVNTVVINNTAICVPVFILPHEHTDLEAPGEKHHHCSHYDSRQAFKAKLHLQNEHFPY